MAKTASGITEILRDRTLRGLRAGTLEPGSRLPSARELVAEFGADNRSILAAYKDLAADGLVEIRERGGVYVRQHAEGATAAALPVKWLSHLLAEGIARDIPAHDLGERVRGLVETVRLRAVVIASTEDQVAGLRRELRENFGFNTEGFVARALVEDGLHAPAMRRADLIIATKAHTDVGERVAGKFSKPCIVVEVRPDLVPGEWAMLLRHPVWAVVHSQKYAEHLQDFLADIRGTDNLSILVYDRDDLSVIPAGAPTYVTHLVRESVHETAFRGRVLPPARTIETASARALCEFIVRANFSAQHAIRRARPNATTRRA